MKKLILLFIALLLCGCENYYNDIGNIAVVSMIAIDYKENNYTSYIKVLSSNKENEEMLYEENCSNLNECFDNLNTKLTKRLYLTHMDLLVLSNNLNKENYNHILNFFMEQKTSRNSFATIIVDKIDSTILNSDTSDINNMLELSQTTNIISSKTTLSDIIKDILNFQISYIPYIETKEKIAIKGYKTIYDENKILTKNESIALNIIKNKIENFTIIIDKELYKLEECNTINKIDNNSIKINLYCKYHGNNKNETNKIETYLYNIIKSFIENNNENYFYYLIYKYGKEHQTNIDYKIEVQIDYTETTGGEIFE